MLAMKSFSKLDRRRFLRNTGIAASAPLASAQTDNPKFVLITCAGTRLAQSLAAGLNDRYRIRLTDRAPIQSRHEFVECALGHDEATTRLVRGAEAVVHVAEPRPGEKTDDQIDFLTRCTYNLLWAASEEKIPRVILLSTLEVMTSYDQDLTVSETWLPQPTLKEGVLARHLGEYTSREFAREARVQIAVLRLGKVVRAEDVKGQPFDPLWVDERDVVQAVSRALSAKLTNWQIFHIGSDSPKARFSVKRAKAGLGYQPRFQW
jgi:nucleoside-diphosphate-sugar epimerase